MRTVPVAAGGEAAGLMRSAPMRTALVSGASRGIGRGIAVDLAAQGFGLTVTARRSPALASLADELREAGAPHVVHIAADLADRDAAGAVAAEHERAFGTMDALVLSGGVGTAGLVGEMLPHRVDKTLAVNLVSVFDLVRLSLPMLRAAAAAPAGMRTGARVVLLSSITGVYAEPGLAVYGASKAGLISLAQTLNAEESGHGVMATAIAPGYVDTDMSDWVKDSVPAEGMIQVADVVGVVRMLLGLSRATSVTRVVMARSGTAGYSA